MNTDLTGKVAIITGGAGALGGEDLLLDAADRHDRSAQGDLAHHGKVRVSGLTGDQR